VTHQDKIEVEHQGSIYSGHYSVEGINKRQLVVYYKGKKRADSFDRRAEQPGYVKCLAGDLLLQMIIEEAAEF